LHQLRMNKCGLVVFPSPKVL